MRKYLAGGLALALALTVGLVGTAAAETTITSDGYDQGIDFAIEGKGKQLTTRSGPLAVEGENYLTYPISPTPTAGRVRLLFDKGVKLNTGKFPRCSKADVAAMEGLSTEDAKALCPKAVVSLDGPANSEAVGAIPADLGPPLGVTIVPLMPAVTAFNGPKMGGDPTVILQTYLAGPPSDTEVLVGKLTKQGKRTLLDVDKVPPLAGGLGSLTDFYATLKAKTKDKKAIKKAKKKKRKATKKVKKAKKKKRKAKSKKAKKKAKKKLKKAKKRKRKAKRKLKKAKKPVQYIQAKCTGGSYETEGTWNMGAYADPTDLDSFVEAFVMNGTDVAPCKGNGNTVDPFDPGDREFILPSP
jgi:hypothetical protein